MSQTCNFCSSPAAFDSATGGFTNPPMCEKHMDMVLVVEFVISRNQEPTLDRVRADINALRRRGGSIAVADDEVPQLLPGVLKALGLGNSGDELPADPKKEQQHA